MPVVLALDLGTSYAKARRFDETGAPVGSLARRPAGIGGQGRGDVEAVVSAAEAVVDEVMASGPPPAAVAISTAWHTLVGVDDDGRPTTELSTWMDDRAGVEAGTLRGAVGDPDDVRDRVGAPIHPSFPSARILWTAHHQPDVFAATARWCSLSEVVASRWFGDRVGPSPSVASASGLYDQRAGTWDAEMLGAIGLPADRLADVDEQPRMGLAGPYRSRWPALAGVPWFAALGDGACAVVGSGCAMPGRAALTVGTSAAVRVQSDVERRRAALLPAALFGYLADAATPIVGAARSNAGAAVEWAAKVLGVAETDVDAVAQATAGRFPGGHGLRVDPSVIAERSPDWPLFASAGVDGLRLTTTPLDILQAFVEAVAFGVADAVDALEAWAGPQALVLAGGASESTGWRSLLADAMGRPVVCSSVTDDSARGAAVLALLRLGEPMPPPPADERVVQPDPTRAAAFAEARAARTQPPFGASLGS
jgi:gluconokinase